MVIVCNGLVIWSCKYQCKTVERRFRMGICGHCYIILVPFNLITLCPVTPLRALRENCIRLGSPISSPVPLLLVSPHHLCWPAIAEWTLLPFAFMPKAYLSLHKKQNPLVLLSSNRLLDKVQLFFGGKNCDFGRLGAGRSLATFFLSHSLISFSFNKSMMPLNVFYLKV